MNYSDEWHEDRCHDCDEPCYAIFLRDQSDKWTEVFQYDCDTCGIYERSHDSLALDRAIEARQEAREDY